MKLPETIGNAILKRHALGQLKSVNIIRTHDGKMYQASLDYGMGSYAVHVDPNPVVAIAYVLATELELKMEIAKNATDERDGVTVADLQMSCGKPVLKRKTHIPKANATQRVEPVRGFDLGDLEDLLG
jgi:hypothetical protein